MKNPVEASKALRSFLVMTVALALSATAQPPVGEDTVDDEILVLLRPGPDHPGPEEVVEAVNAGRIPIPGGLGEGNPHRAELVIRNRARGAARDRLLADSDLPRARLERTIVLHYPSVAAVPGILMALANGNPHVEFAEQNRPIRFHSATASAPMLKSTLPQDEYFGPDGGDPEGHQWGPFIMGLPDGWGYVQGHAVVALLDRGIQPGHPELEPFDDSGIVTVFLGGNYRENWSYDFIGEDCDVDEKKDPTTERASHGTHVSGIVGATANNGQGVAGYCWHCPIVMAKIWNQDVQTGLDDVAQALVGALDRGVQIATMSFGVDGDCSQSPYDLSSFCQALFEANARDLLLTASVGNDREPVVEFPAADSRVVAVGGIAPGGSFWDDWPNCPYGFQQSFECGSNYGLKQELVAPAKWVLSTVYTGTYSNSVVRCGDPYGAVGNASDGIGLCTGTSMAAPAVAGTGALVRTANPLLGQGQVRGILRTTASLGGSFDSKLGYGVPNAGGAVMEAMGRVGGLVLRNRLTPWFALYSSDHTVHLYTTSPQRAAAAVAGIDGVPFSPIGTAVPAYPTFPGVTATPRASVFLFTAPHAPLGKTFGLLPLYRMSKDPNRQQLCTGVPESGAQWSFAYASTVSEILSLRNDGYALDGIEGYVIDPAGPLPAGAVLLHRLYNTGLGDWVVVPTSEIPSLPAGYGPRAGIDEIVGAAFPNVDSDGDAVINGFETTIGTNALAADSDGDGISDGDEILGYTGATPSGILGDPLCSGTSCLFADGFETGDTSHWSTVVP